jgi:hypothetical protein
LDCCVEEGSRERAPEPEDALGRWISGGSVGFVDTKFGMRPIRAAYLEANLEPFVEVLGEEGFLGVG